MGMLIGELEGVSDGALSPMPVGPEVGWTDGNALGFSDGETLGVELGEVLGCFEGEMLG